MYYKGKIYITRQNMNRLYHRTKPIWDVLRESGAVLLTNAGRVFGDESARSDIIGVDFMDARLRFLTDWKHHFVISNALARDKFEVRELHVNKLPVIVVETDEMKRARINNERRY